MVAARIRDYIIEHSLGQGDRLPTEHEMAELFGVSRSSVREATKALGFLGIIVSAPKRGLTVGSVDMQRVTEYLGFHFSLNNYPKEQLLRARSVLEKGALPGVMEQMASDPRIYETLRKLAEGLDGVSDVDAFIRGDTAFHRALLESSGIEPLVAFGDLLGIFFLRFRREVFAARQGWASGIRMHKALLDALRNKDLQGAERILNEHLQYYRGMP
jgi:GntR family transcriptional regulator, transcriptional repressor for pyruvate dehydrogenase complex